MRKIDTSSWRPFPIGELFEKPALKPKDGFRKALDASTERDEQFSVPLVNAKHGNNGIMYYGKPEFFDTVENSLDIVQNGAAAVGDVYYQPQATGVLGDAYLVTVRGRECSENEMLFLATVMYKTIKGRFSYDDKATWDRVKAVSVMLPATPEGEPDWDFMDAFIEGMKADVESSLSAMMTLSYYYVGM